MHLRSFLKTLSGRILKVRDLPALDAQALRLRYVDIQPLSGLIRDECGVRQTVAVVTLTHLVGASTRNNKGGTPISKEWVLLPYAWWDSAQESVEQDVKLPASDHTSYGGTDDE